MSDEKANVLDSNRIVYMMGVFTEEKAKEVITRLWTLESQNPTKDILLYIDSRGGEVHSYLAMHDVINLLRCDVATICIGKAMSAGQMLLMTGKKGKRFITPHARVMCHELSTLIGGSMKEIEVSVEESKKLQEILTGLLIKYTKITKSQAKEMRANDTYYSATEALEMGIVDHIVKKPKDLYSRIN